MIGTQTDDGKRIDRQWEENAARRLAERVSEAERRGGWLFVVLGGVRPLEAARHFGGKRRGVLAELASINPRVAQAGSWRGWFNGAGVLLPFPWGDPWLRPMRLRVSQPLTAGPWYVVELDEPINC